MEIYQGDAFNLPFTLLIDGAMLQPEILEEMEVTLDIIQKTMSKGSIYFENGQFVMPLTQQETFRLTVGSHAVQVRVKIQDTQEVYTIALSPSLMVLPSQSKEVI